MDQLLALFHKFTIFDLLDIAIVSFVFYRVILLIRGTRAVPLLKGIIVLLIATGLSHLLHLQALNWLLSEVLMLGVIAIPIVFQPELRRALEQLGRSNPFHVHWKWQGTSDSEQVINELVQACAVFAKNRIGALIVLERDTGLTEYVETGIPIGGLVTSQLLINGFIPNTPLHDGAMIVRGDRVVAASCYLPLSDRMDISKELGTRHRAAVGISEQSDAVALVVSEETGQISIAQGGELTRGLDEASLRELLQGALEPLATTAFRLWRRAGTT
jgi:diadenylate cyclase